MSRKVFVLNILISFLRNERKLTDLRPEWVEGCGKEERKSEGVEEEAKHFDPVLKS